MNRWIFLGLAALFFYSQQLLAQMPIQAVTFDQFDSMMGTISTPFPIDLTTIAQGDTVTFFQAISSNTGGPEGTGFGAAVAWLENGTDIKAITFAQDGAGPLSTSGVLDLGTASGTVTDFLLGGREPQTAGLGAVVVWVENGVDIKAVTFNALGGSSTISPIVPLATAAVGSTFFRLTGGYPESMPNGAVVAWVDVDGLTINAINFYQNGVLGSQTPLNFGPATSPITDFQITGQTPAPQGGEEPRNNIAVAWVQDGGVEIYEQVYTCGIIHLGSTLVGTVENFQLVGEFPGSEGLGAAVAWIEGGVNFRGATFECGSVDFFSPIFNLGTASGVVSGFQLTGGFPSTVNSGAAIAWVENGIDVKAITFDYQLSLNKTPILLLGSASAGNEVSNFRLTGLDPEKSTGLGAAVAWTEGGVNLKAVTFNAFTMTSTISPIISLGTTPSTIIDFALTGAFPERSGDGAALVWLGEPIPIPPPPGSTTPRSWKRPSNPRVRR